MTTDTPTDERKELLDSLQSLETQGVGSARIPVHPSLRSLLPGGLRAGEVCISSGSRSVAMALLAESTQRGSWCAVVGLDDLGVESMQQAGVNLERIVLVARPPAHRWGSIVATVSEAAQIVLAADPPPFTDAELRRLTARMRTHRSALVIAAAQRMGRFRARTRLHAEVAGWDGMRPYGQGLLRRQRVEVEAVDRHRHHRADLWFPLDGVSGSDVLGSDALGSDVSDAPVSGDGGHVPAPSTAPPVELPRSA